MKVIGSKWVGCRRKPYWNALDALAFGVISPELFKNDGRVKGNRTKANHALWVKKMKKKNRKGR